MMYKFRSTLRDLLVDVTDPTVLSTFDKADWLSGLAPILRLSDADYADPITYGFINNYLIPHFFLFEIVQWVETDEEEPDLYMWKMSGLFHATQDYYVERITDIAAVNALLKANKYGSDAIVASTVGQDSTGESLSKSNDTPLASTNSDLANDTYLSGSDKVNTTGSVDTVSSSTASNYNQLFNALQAIPGVRNLYNEWLQEFNSILVVAR